MENSIPQHCPGTESESAGKAAACAGCPNQNACASSKPNEPDPDMDVIKANLSLVKNIIVILSGKGGVGKSTFTSMLAQSLAYDTNINVGIMDIDLCGPSMPKILGVEKEQAHLSGSGWSPVFIEENLCVMSIGFLLPGPEVAVIWRGPKKNGLIKQFLKDVDWGELDYLLVDTPPGTSDEHLSIVKLLQDCRLKGAIIITTPQEASLLDVRKEINFCEKVQLPILGVVENMSVFICPNCKVSTEIFPPTTGGGQKMAEDLNVPFLGKFPLNSEIGQGCDEGRLFARSVEFVAKDQLKTIRKSIIQRLETQ